MTLLQQFLISVSLPLAFLFLLLYSWQRYRQREEEYLRHWLLALFSILIWASSIPSYYIGAPVPQEVTFLWRAAGRHALSLSALLLLLTAASYLNTPWRTRRLVAAISLGLWLLGLILDPAILPFALPTPVIGNQRLTPFNLWAGIWVASWLVALLAAWILTWNTLQSTPRSLYRNQINYWALSLTLFLVGGSLALIQQPGQPLWQELSGLIQILAVVTGVNSLTRTTLPDLRLTLRHLGARLASSLLIFAMTWLALWYVAFNVAQRAESGTMLDLIFIAAILAALFMGANRIVRRFIRHLFLPTATADEMVLAHQPDLGDSLLHPDTLADLTLRLTQTNLATEEAAIFLAEEGPAGALTLRPLACVNGGVRLSPLTLAGHSPLTEHLRRTPATALFAYDVENLDSFTAMSPEEKDSLRQWQCQLLIALQAGQQVAAVLVLGDKYTGAPYTMVDATWLQTLAAQVGPLLLQAQHLDNLARVNRHVFDELQALSRERQYLQELGALYAQFARLASPELRVPLASLSQGIQQLQSGEGSTDTDTLQHQLAQLRLMVDQLIVTADRVQKQSAFVFGTMRLDEAINQAVRNLAAMAEARRVKVLVETDPRLPSIQGDKQRLIEAIQYLLHNAIKFNKIGGEVRIECTPAGNELYLRVHDTGVGIPEQRLEQIWTEFGHKHNGSGALRGTSPGLGLLLTRFIVRAHGGRVEAESHYGAGSTFTVYLPLMLEQ